MHCTHMRVLLTRIFAKRTYSIQSNSSIYEKTGAAVKDKF